MKNVQTNTNRSRNTQKAILHAAVKLAKQDGWSKTTVRKICKQANISIGAFYHHFKSKQELVNRAFIFFDNTLAENFPDEQSDPIDAIKRVLLMQTSFIVDEAGLLIIEYYRNILESENNYAISPTRIYYQKILSFSTQAVNCSLFKYDYTPEYITEFLIKYVRGNIIDWILHNGSYDVVTRTESEINILLNSLCKKRQ